MADDIYAFTLNLDKRLNSIVTPARIRIAESVAKLFKLPLKDKKIDALWDTGATNTVISKTLAEYLGLKPITMVTTFSADGKHDSYVYKVDLWLPNTVVVTDLPVTEALEIPDFGILIGMDIITMGDFAITNANNITVMSFRIPPDTKHIDYKKSHRPEQLSAVVAEGKQPPTQS